MANKIHIIKFLNLLQKATLNWSIPHVRVTFTKDIYKVGMNGGNAKLFINGTNDIITGLRSNDELEMNFQDTVKNIKAYLSIILPDADGFADIQIKDEKIIIKSGNQRTQCFFCSAQIPTIFNKMPKNTGTEIAKFNIDEEFVTAYSLIKKVAGGFGKIYFGVNERSLFIEAGDRTSPHTNNMTIKLQESSSDDMFVCFDFKSFNDIMTLMGSDVYNFSFSLGYQPLRKSGLISITKGEEEMYLLVSLRENV